MDAIVLHAGLARHNGDWNWQDVRSPFARIYFVTEGSADIVFKNRPVGFIDSSEGFKTSPMGFIDSSEDLKTSSEDLKTSYVDFTACAVGKNAGERVCRLTHGHLYLVPPFVPHSNRCDGVFTHYYIHIYESAETLSGLFEEYSFPCEVKAETHDEWLFERICRINSGKTLLESDPRSYDNPETLQHYVAESRANNLAVKMESDGIVNQLMARFLANAVRTHHVHDTRIKQTRDFIRQNLHRNISIDELAEMTHLSKDHFIRLFKTECGLSPLLYINHRKIESAETKLITTDLNVKEIAYSLGFSDYSYFTRLFRQTTGTTPVAYRKSAVKAR